MGNNAAIFRSSVHTTSQHYIRTEAYNDHWLNGEVQKLIRHVVLVFDPIRELGADF